MRPYTVCLLAVCFLLPFTACDSPTDVPANRRKELLNDLPKHPTIGYGGVHLYDCPEEDEFSIAILLIADVQDLPLEISSIYFFSEVADVDVINFDRTQEFHSTYYATVTLHNNGDRDNIEWLELLAIVNGEFQVPFSVDMRRGADASEQEDRNIEFGDVVIGEEASNNDVMCNHCSSGWQLESIEFDDPSGAFEPQLPAIPADISRGEEFTIGMLFKPTEAGDHIAVLRLNFRDDGGKNLQWMYTYSGRGI